MLRHDASSAVGSVDLTEQNTQNTGRSAGAPLAQVGLWNQGEGRSLLRAHYPQSGRFCAGPLPAQAEEEPARPPLLLPPLSCSTYPTVGVNTVT